MLDLSGRIGQIALAVSDLNTALGFYRDILGLWFLIQPSLQQAFLQGDIPSLC